MSGAMRTVSKGARAVCLFSLFWSQRALAQSAGLVADRFVAASGSGSFLQVEEAPVPAARQLLLTIGSWVVADPVTVNRLGARQVPLRYRVALDLAGELGVFRDRLALGIGLPVVLWQDGQVPLAMSPSASAPLSTTEVGDLRLHGKAELLQQGLPVSLATAIELTVPGGGEGNLAGSPSPTIAGRVLLSCRSSLVSAALNLAVRFARQGQLDNLTLGRHLDWGIAVGVDVVPKGPRRPLGLMLLAEMTGLIGLAAPESSYPVELRGALRLLLGRVTIDAGGGGGIGDVSLSPTWRALLVVRTPITGPAQAHRNPPPAANSP